MDGHAERARRNEDGQRRRGRPVSAASGGAQGQPRQTLSVPDAVGIIVGLIVGAGIFGTPAIVAGAMGSEPLILAAWVAGGLFSVIGALCYAELATAFPSPGGEYHFIHRAYGRSLAFLYGWARMTVIVAGSIAVFAYLFGDYLSRVVNLGAHSSAIWAAFVVVVLTGVNYAGIREGKATQNLFTALEVAGLVLIVVAGLVLAPAPAAPAAAAPAPGGGGPWYMGAGLGTAMLFVLFTYGGWNDAAYISAEVRRRERNMSRALLLAIGIVAVLYVLVNVAYLKGLGYEAMARSDAVAADLLKAVWGGTGEKIISVMIAIAALTSVNGSIIVGARSNYALGRDWPLLGVLGRWDEASGSPRAAMLVQGAIALALVGLGAIRSAGFKGLVEYSLPVFWGFFLLVGIALFVLRVREPGAPRPFRVPGYPVIPAIFVLMCGYLLYSSLAYHRTHALTGLGVLAVGAVVLLFAGRSKRIAS
ncbi:MAG: amino acid permease [Burkholderiales bacterium]|nr:amino acid permease [Burkholderiales bacterium]